MIKYSVIVCSYNGSRWIGECLEGLSRQTLPKDSYEVIVVDDGSTDGLAGVVKKAISPYPNMRLISYKPNKGLSAARNTGWQSAKGEIIFYIDDDAIPDHDWMERIIAYYTSDKIAGVGGYQRAYFGDNLYNIYDIARCKLEYGPNAEVLNDNNYGSGGCNMSLRKSVLKEVGGFDSLFRSVADDADVNRRIAEKGYRLLCVSEITVRHRYPTSLREFFRKRAGRGKGEFLYDQKYKKKQVVFRCVASIILTAVNIPKNFMAGLRLSIFSGRYDLLPAFMFLYPLDRIFVKYGKLKSALGVKS